LILDEIDGQSHRAQSPDGEDRSDRRLQIDPFENSARLLVQFAGMTKFDEVIWHLYHFVPTSPSSIENVLGDGVPQRHLAQHPGVGQQIYPNRTGWPGKSFRRVSIDPLGDDPVLPIDNQRVDDDKALAVNHDPRFGDCMNHRSMPPLLNRDLANFEKHITFVINSQVIIRGTGKSLFPRIQAGLKPSPHLFHTPLGSFGLRRKRRLQPLEGMLIRMRFRTICCCRRRRKTAVGQPDSTALELPFTHREHRSLRRSKKRISLPAAKLFGCPSVDADTCIGWPLPQVTQILAA
jgi:hypothetical protein